MSARQNTFLGSNEDESYDSGIPSPGSAPYTHPDQFYPPNAPSPPGGLRADGYGGLNTQAGWPGEQFNAPANFGDTGFSGFVFNTNQSPMPSYGATVISGSQPPLSQQSNGTYPRSPHANSQYQPQLPGPPPQQDLTQQPSDQVLPGPGIGATTVTQEEFNEIMAYINGPGPFTHEQLDDIKTLLNGPPLFVTNQHASPPNLGLAPEQDNVPGAKGSDTLRRTGDFGTNFSNGGNYPSGDGSAPRSESTRSSFPLLQGLNERAFQREGDLTGGDELFTGNIAVSQPTASGRFAAGGAQQQSFTSANLSAINTPSPTDTHEARFAPNTQDHNYISTSTEQGTNIPGVTSLPGLTTNVHAFENTGGARAWFNEVRRKAERKTDPKLLDLYRNNKAEWIGKLKTRIATAPSLPKNPSEIDVINEKMRVSFVEHVHKKCGFEQDGVTLRIQDDVGTVDHAELDQIYSAFAQMIFDDFIKFHEAGGDSYFVDPKPSMFDPRDLEWLPAQRMALLLAGLFQAKFLAIALWNGQDAVKELVSRPASSLDSRYPSFKSNQSRGKRTEQKRLQAEKSSGQSQDAGNTDVFGQHDNLNHSNAKKNRPRMEKQSTLIPKAQNLLDDDGFVENGPRSVPKKARRKKTVIASSPTDQNERFDHGGRSNAVTASSLGGGKTSG